MRTQFPLDPEGALERLRAAARPQQAPSSNLPVDPDTALRTLLAGMSERSLAVVDRP